MRGAMTKKKAERDGYRVLTSPLEDDSPPTRAPLHLEAVR